MSICPEFYEMTRALLSKAGLSTNFSIERIPAGGNNRVYKLACDQRGNYLLKEYFTNVSDTRNRLYTEYTFLTFLWNKGIKVIPEPIICSYENNIGLYQFIEGRVLCPSDISNEQVDELISFFFKINTLKNSPDALSLPAASDACFSVQEHLDHIQNRVNRITTIDRESDVDSEAGDFIDNVLRPEWEQIYKTIQISVVDNPILSLNLPEEERVLSPSDFGFHNVLMKPEGSLVFIDFEYAGWDDPVKTICDLFCQPKIPLDFRNFEPIAMSILHESGGDLDMGLVRLRLLLPAYRIKWCCILMNEFLPIGKKRRLFADPSHGTEKRKAEQLEKAKKLLHYNR